MTDRAHQYLQRRSVVQVSPEAERRLFSPEVIDRAKQPPRGWFRSFFWAKLLGKKFVTRSGPATCTFYLWRDHTYVTNLTVNE